MPYIKQITLRRGMLQQNKNGKTKKNEVRSYFCKSIKLWNEVKCI